MVNVIDMLLPRENYPATGTYRHTQNATADHFDYDYVDAPNKAYGQTINNLLKDPSITTIRTTDNLGWRNNGTVVLQDDILYTIHAVRTIHSEKNKSALRLLKSNPSTDYILALKEKDNPMGLI